MEIVRTEIQSPETRIEAAQVAMAAPVELTEDECKLVAGGKRPIGKDPEDAVVTG